MEVAIYNIEGQETGRTATLPDEVFGIEPNEHAVYLSVKQYLANQRQGTHKAKERAEIAGSTKKLKKQKGTGTARSGSIKSPVFRGGGRIFGPRPRSYDIKVNQKVKRLARKSALTYKAKEQAIKVVEDFDFDAPKTKQYVDVLGKLNAADVKTLLVTSENTPNVVLSARNLPNCRVVEAALLNTYDILHADQLLISEQSVEKIIANF